MAKFGHAVIEGDLLVLMQNLRYVQDLLAAPRTEELLDSPRRATSPRLIPNEREAEAPAHNFRSSVPGTSAATALPGVATTLTPRLTNSAASAGNRSN